MIRPVISLVRDLAADTRVRLYSHLDTELVDVIKN